MVSCYLVVLVNLEDMFIHVLNQDQWAQFKAIEEDPMAALSQLGGEDPPWFSTVMEALTYIHDQGLEVKEEVQGCAY